MSHQTFYEEDLSTQISMLAKLLKSLGATDLETNVNESNRQKVLVDCTSKLNLLLKHNFENKEDFGNTYITIAMVLMTLDMDTLSIAVDNLCRVFKENIDIDEKFVYPQVFALDILYKNLLPDHVLRLKIYDTILDAALKYPNINLMNDPKRIQKWLSVVTEHDEEKASIWKKLSLVNSQLGDNKKSIDCMIYLLETYTEKNASKGRNDAFSCIVSIIQEPKILSMDNLLSLKAVQFLEGESIFDLLQIFISGDLGEYEAFRKKNAKFLTDNKINDEFCMKKLRILCFMEMSNNSTELSYEAISKKLKIQLDQVENFVVDVVHQNVVNCKIDQVNSKVTVLSALPRSFGIEEWKKLQHNLADWKCSLTKVKSSLRSMSTNGIVHA